MTHASYAQGESHRSTLLSGFVVAMAFLGICFVLLTMPVMAANVDNELYINKYVERNSFDSQQPIDKMTGILKGSVRCGLNTFTNEVGVRNDAIPDAANQSFEFYPINPDGTFEITLIPGSFTLYLKDGNGGQPEYSHATIIANSISNPEHELLGHAIPPAIGKVVDKIVILKATYGMTKIVIDRAFVPAVPGVPAVTHIVHHAAIPAVPAQPAVPEHFHRVGHDQGDYENSHGQYHYVGMGHGDYLYIAPVSAIPAVPAVPAWNEVIVDAPAIPAIPAIPEISHVEGTYVDVTAQVAQMTSTANPHQSFAFNNAMNPGGIVNVAQDTVLVVIADPAPGQVKNVMIKYTLNGVEKTIDTMEYETINL
jgi:hypothetical protein